MTRNARNTVVAHELDLAACMAFCRLESILSASLSIAHMTTLLHKIFKFSISGIGGITPLKAVSYMYNQKPSGPHLELPEGAYQAWSRYSQSPYLNGSSRLHIQTLHPEEADNITFHS